MDGSEAAARPTPPVRGKRLGETMLAMGAASAGALESALSAQRASGARLGAILAARGLASPGAVADALALQAGLERADLARRPLDPALLDPRDLGVCLRRRIAPWRRAGDGATVWAAVDVAEAARGLADLGARGAGGRIALVDPAVVRKHREP